MLKKILIFLAIIGFSQLQAQETNSLYITKKIIISKDTIFFEKKSINSRLFKLLDANEKQIDSTNYKVNFEKAFLILNEKFKANSDSITVKYLQFPDFLTKTYQALDKSKILSNDAALGVLYQIEKENNSQKNTPFDGLSTSGSISRGVTIGNNQNSVLNSNLDLQITGKLSEKVSLRASLQDSNIPLQDGGYSQQLDQFDNIFMELFSEKWSVKAGDIFLGNQATQFLNFNKKVQGLSTHFDFGSEDNKTSIFASAGLVRGQYAKSDFVGQEGNQGPYKLIGRSGELYVLVISGSERVFVNGILLKRGENNDYTIDYNAGEILFTPLFTITSEMRIAVEYQFTNQNYNRFISYVGGKHQSKKWGFASYLYSENDLKNQSLLQTLSEEQAQILVNAGDNQTLMEAPSAFLDSYSNNKILYKKTVLPNGIEIFENSNNPQDVLYNVRFTPVVGKKGSYVLNENAAVGRVFSYDPINGNYDPVIQLIAPIKTQVATFLGNYNPSEKTNFDFEVGVCNNDQNLFSTLDDKNNVGLATKINAKQRLFSKKWTADVFGKYQFIAKNFSSVERIYSIEFNRDWNIGVLQNSNQSYLVSGLQMSLPEKGSLIYQFEKLDFDKQFAGNKHSLNANFNLKNWNIQSAGSFLNSDSNTYKSTFLRNQTQTKYHFKKNWIGGNLRLEDNQEKNKITGQFSALSQSFAQYGFFAGRGDSTKVFVELGYYKRVNDSLQNGKIERVNASQTFAIRSKLIQTNKSDLTFFANYRILDFENKSQKSEPSLNSRILYNDRFFNQFVQTTTAFETISGSIPQQEFSYLEVAVGQGVYTWNDYNKDEIQQLEEFEVAPFIDQAKYIRVYLPNRIYLKTFQNKLSQSLILNPNQWQNKTGFKKILSHFYNQTSLLFDRKVANKGNLDLNPFENSGENVLGLNSSFRNSLFFNRAKQKHSVTYTFVINQNLNQLTVGTQNAKNSSHQLQYNHLIQKSWLLGLFAKTIQTNMISQNFPDKNFEILGSQLAPKLSYLFSKSTSWDLFFELTKKENQSIQSETLLQQRFGSSFAYAGEKKFTFNCEISFYQNKYDGDAFSSVGFQMLEGLQTGQNLTWRLLFQKNLTNFLDINVNYQGRKSQTSQAIHTGNVQLRAYF